MRRGCRHDDSVSINPAVIIQYHTKRYQLHCSAESHSLRSMQSMTSRLWFKTYRWTQKVTRCKQWSTFYHSVALRRLTECQASWPGCVHPSLSLPLASLISPSFSYLPLLSLPYSPLALRSRTIYCGSGIERLSSPQRVRPAAKRYLVHVGREKCFW